MVYLNRTHVYSLIRKTMNLKKREIATKLNYNESNLAPKRPYDPDRLYEHIFKMENSEKELNKLNFIKHLIEHDKEYEGIKESLNDIWGNNYVDFVKELLNRGNVSPPVNKSLDKPDSGNNELVSQNEDIGAQLHIRDMYKICLYCKRWKGNVEDVKEIVPDVYGRCILYNQDQRSTGGANCNDYEPNFSSITTHMLGSPFLM